MRRKILLCLTFFLVSPVILGLSLYLGSSSPFFPWYNQQNLVIPYAKVLGDSTQKLSAESQQNNKVVAYAVQAMDSTPVIIENYLKRYNSPLLPYKDKIVSEAIKYKIKPQLIVAIAQQESNLGKKSPENCYNAWGWAIHEKGTLCFNSWNEAIETVTAGIAKGYCSKGYCDDPCEMMKKYTPKSNGSWCLGIKQFLSEMETGNF